MEEADPNKDEVFISGLPLDITEKEIAEYFGQIGIIKEVSKIIWNVVYVLALGGEAIG
jgi:RNA recognition motif-containing protein